MTAPHTLGVAALSQALRAKEMSSVELTQSLLGRIAAHDALGAFLATHAENALAEARAADAAIAAGTATPLTGVPIAHKDIFVTDFARTGLPTTAGSKILANYASPYDATVVARLAAAGAVTLGKLNCDEFAMGSANENSAYGLARNPWDMQRVPGGSSGGSAAAVAARLVPAATGTDTGGSIRQPASFTGITGIKPTYGVCSRYGMVAFASSLDQAGPLARTAEDCALLLSAMSGFDERDATSAERPPQDFHAQMLKPREGAPATKPLQGLRIGLPKEFFPAALAADVNGAVRAALAELEKLGATLVDVSLPRTELSIPVYYLIAPAEASSNPQPLRRREVRTPRGTVRRPAGHVQEDARRRLRPRGEAPHHDRHLRAEPRLLRRLLPAGAEAAPHDRRRFPGLLQAVRPDRRPGGTDGGVEDRRTGRRPG